MLGVGGGDLENVDVLLGSVLGEARSDGDTLGLASSDSVALMDGVC